MQDPIFGSRNKLQHFSGSPKTENPLNCTLLGQFPPLVQHGKETTLGENMPTEKREKERLNDLVIDLFLTLYTRLPELSTEKMDGLVEFYVRKLFCLFGYNNEDYVRPVKAGTTSTSFWSEGPDRREIFLSDLSLWTAETFFQLLREAFSNVQAQLLKPFLHDHLIIQIDEPMTSEQGASRRNISFTTSTTDKYHQDYQRANQTVQYVRSLTLAHNKLQMLAFASANPGDLICKDETWYNFWAVPSTKSNHLYFETSMMNNCMFQQYHSDSPLLSQGCMNALSAAPAKIRELELEENAYFLFISHIILLVVNLTSCLALLMPLTSMARFERRMDRGRQRLEQELNDPFLRQALERKAEELPEEERRNFIPRLEARIASWDSKAAAIKLLRRYVRFFRLTLLFTMVSLSIVYLFLHLFHVSSMSQYLEIQTMSMTMMAASYWAPIGDSAKEEEAFKRPAEIMMASATHFMTLDPSSTQALLDKSSSSEGEASNAKHGTV